MPAQLPVDRYRPKLISMEPGQDAWTVPWAMAVDDDGSCWICTRYTRHASSGGTVTLLVRRRSDGYHVEAHGPYEWSPAPAEARLGDGWEPVQTFTDAMRRAIR